MYHLKRGHICETVYRDDEYEVYWVASDDGTETWLEIAWAEGGPAYAPLLRHQDGSPSQVWAMNALQNIGHRLLYALMDGGGEFDLRRIGERHE